jgi:hypothetical protein
MDFTQQGPRHAVGLAAFAAESAYSIFRVSVCRVDELKWLFSQEKATLHTLTYSTLTLKML